MNRATETFSAMLDLIEFELVNYEDGYGLVDLQGANLGDIEADRFNSASEIIERLDIYLRELYFDDLEEESDRYGICSAGDTAPLSAAEWVRFMDKHPDFKANHTHEYAVMEMITNHADEVKLDEITACKD